MLEASPTVFCQLHPAAEEVELSLLDSQHLTATAKTSTIGPGYHIFLCDMLKALARDFDLVWEEQDWHNDEDVEYFDEADYFFSGEQRRVFDAMTRWLRCLAGAFFDGTLKEGDTNIMLCMKIGEVFESDQPAITLMGPRSHEWLLKTSKDAEAGRDFFAWWSCGLNAEYFLGRALARMWAEVRWRKPINDNERKLLKYVADSLDIAYKLNPSLNYPWAEWAEILEYLDEQSADNDFVRARPKGKPTIGYRRNNVRISMGGYWSIKIPGSFSEFEVDEDSASSAFDPPKEVWFTAFSSNPENPRKAFEEQRAQILGKQPELLREEENFIAEGKITKKSQDGREYFVLISSNVGLAKRAVCTIVFTDPADRDWAVEVWRSIQPPKA
jgi:hypothetical protein